MNKQKQLLLLSSFGALPAFDALFREHNYQVTKVKALRKALSQIKQLKPDVIVAEFVYAPTYGSQLSNFESLFAAAQTFAPETSFIALAHKDDLQHLEKVSANVNNCQIVTFPVDQSEMRSCLNSIAETNRDS